MSSRALRAGSAPVTGVLALLLILAMSTANAATDIENYRLTEAALDKYERATEGMYEFALANPDIAKAMNADDEDSDDATVEQMAKRLDERAPGLRKAVEKSGMKLEEYFTFSFSMAANALGYMMSEQMGGMDASKLTAVQRDNIAFIKKNMPRMEQFGARMEEKYGKILGDDEEEEYYEDEYTDEENYEE